MSAAIAVDGLAKHFGGRVAVEGLSFEVSPGEVFGLLGPNGAGKTTTVRMLTGLLRPSAGAASVCGISLAQSGNALRETVGLLTEQPGLYDRLTGRENLRFFVKLHQLDEGKAWERCRQYLKRFGLDGREDDPCGTYSKGMRQKLAIIRAIVHAPKVIFLDEPTSGLDPEAARTVRDAVAELATEGCTIVLCSHNLPEVERLCTRVAVIKNRLRSVFQVKDMDADKRTVRVRVEGDANAFVPALAPLGNASVEDGTLVLPVSSDSEIPDAVALLVRGGARILQVSPTRRTLEEVYLNLVKEEAA